MLILSSHRALYAFGHKESWVPQKGQRGGEVLALLARVISGAGSQGHVERLVDVVAALVAHDLVTVTRYSATRRPEFVLHRNFSDEMVRRYLEIFYPHDPFHRYWRLRRKPGVVPLNRLAIRDVKRGRYIAEFLSQSVITDEVGVLLDDGSDWCLAIFLDRSSGKFRPAEVARLEAHFAAISALHALHLKLHRPIRPTTERHSTSPLLPRPEELTELWPDLSSRERQLVGLILAGHPSATIAKRLGITLGTVKNHRRRIYQKLDITTERELFLQYFHQISAAQGPS
jgi:DNA-binding CsgD family transcriptional regulator